jgi:hypothetical protein
MKSKDDSGGPERKGADPKGGATEVPASATEMFARPMAPRAQPEFDIPGGEKKGASRVAAPEETAGKRASAGADESRPSYASQPAAGAFSAGEKPAPGEFTQLFQAITTGQAITPKAEAIQAEAAIERSAPMPTPPTTPPAADPKAGEFTSIFMRLPKDPERPPESSAEGSPRGMGNPAPAEPGEFTRLMRATELTAKPPVSGGSPAVAPAAPLSAPVRGISAQGSNDAVSGTAGMTEFFVAPSPRTGGHGAGPLSSPQGSKAAPSNESRWASAQAPSGFPGGSLPNQESIGAEQSSGEFTRLFRALDSNRESSNQPPALDMAPSASAPQIPQAGKLPDSGGGEFTQLMQSLSQKETAMPAAPRDITPPTARVWPEPMAVRPTGAADESASFTRIISSSAAREEAAQGTKPGADALPAQGGLSASPAAAMPRMPQPLAPSIPRAGSFGQPPAAATPTPVPPTSVPASVSQSKLQAYLPLLLIVNACALAVLIVLVVIALRRH